MYPKSNQVFTSKVFGLGIFFEENVCSLAWIFFACLKLLGNEQGIDARIFQAARSFTTIFYAGSLNFLCFSIQCLYDPVGSFCVLFVPDLPWYQPIYGCRQLLAWRTLQELNPVWNTVSKCTCKMTMQITAEPKITT